MTKILGGSEGPARLEVPVDEAVKSLQRALGLRVPGRQNHPAEAEQAEIGGKPLTRMAGAPVKGALPVKHELARQHPNLAKAGADPERDVLQGLREHQLGRKHLRKRQGERNQIALPVLVESNRNPIPKLNQVYLGELTGTVGRLLESAGQRRKSRPYLTKQGEQNAHPAVVAHRLDLLEDPHPRKGVIFPEQPLDLAQIGIKLRRAP